MHWPEFAERLGAALTRLTADQHTEATVIISQLTQPSAYVQFLVNTGGVYAEVCSARSYIAKELRLAPESLAVLKDAGWRQPRVPRTENWYAEAAGGADCMELANKCVVALRDVWRVPDPHTLVYQGFNGNTNDDVIVDELGLNREATP